VFFGTPRAAEPSLRALAASRHSPAAVVCQPDRPAGRGRRLSSPPVKEAALELGIPVLQPGSVKTRLFREEIAALDPGVLVVVAYGRLLGPKLRATAPEGAVNVHFSLLPRWRGAAPVQRALLAGDERTGVSLIRLVDELDAGPVLAREEVAIEPNERASQLEARLAVIGARLLVSVLDGLEAGRVTEEPQDERAVTLAPPLRREEGRLDPARPASELERRVRALDPWPGARLETGGPAIAVLEAEARAAGAGDRPPGTVLPARGEALPLACGEGSVLLLRRVKPAGRGAMSGSSLVQGRHLSVGQRLPTAAAAGA
jgi:methionyl-tRNA formyltransferase